MSKPNDPTYVLWLIASCAAGLLIGLSIGAAVEDEYGRASYLLLAAIAGLLLYRHWAERLVWAESQP